MAFQVSLGVLCAPGVATPVCRHGETSLVLHSPLYQSAVSCRAERTARAMTPLLTEKLPGQHSRKRAGLVVELLGTRYHHHRSKQVLLTYPTPSQPQHFSIH